MTEEILAAARRICEPILKKGRGIINRNFTVHISADIKTLLEFQQQLGLFIRRWNNKKEKEIREFYKGDKGGKN